MKKILDKVDGAEARYTQELAPDGKRLREIAAVLGVGRRALREYELMPWWRRLAPRRRRQAVGWLGFMSAFALALLEQDADSSA